MEKIIDCAVLFALAIFAVIASLLIHATFLESTFLFLGLPSIYFLLHGKTKSHETLAAVVVFGVLYCFLLDYLAELNGAWAWKPSQLIFQQKILGVVSPDAIIWTALWVLLLVLFYNHVIDHNMRDRVSRKIWYAVGVGLASLAGIIWLQLHSPSHLHITYAYFYLGLCTFPPLFYVIWKKPRIVPKLLLASLYFIPLYFVYELVGDALGQWDFPGHYIALIHIGTITFPIEEFLFWIVCSSVITLGGYELFIDDC